MEMAKLMQSIQTIGAAASGWLWHFAGYYLHGRHAISNETKAANVQPAHA
jgi:hypothetical protein